MVVAGVQHLRRAAYLDTGDGTCVELFDRDADIPAQGREREPDDDLVQNALLHLALRVPNAEAAYKRALQAGATSYIEPNSLELGDPPLSLRNALVHSPNGEVIEFVESDDL